VGECGLDSIGTEEGSVVGTYTHGNEPLGSILGREFLNRLSDYQHLKEDSAPQISFLVILLDLTADKMQSSETLNTSNIISETEDYQKNYLIIINRMETNTQKNS
jgi:hypothetical protein